MVPHLAGKLYDAARQLPFTAKFRPDPASLPVQRVADDAGLALKNFPASSRKHGWYCKSLTAQEDCLHLCGTGVIHVVTAEGDFTMATPNTEEQATLAAEGAAQEPKARLPAQAEDRGPSRAHSTRFVRGKAA